MKIYFHTQHSCGAGAKIKLPPGAGAEIKFSPGAGAENTNCGSGSFYLSKKFYRQLSLMLKEVF
jgi:hypothetical protein